jgi:hypothetical protein
MDPIEKRPYEEVKEEIFSDFDWQKMHIIMVSLDWTYNYGGGKKRIPSIEDLKDCADEILEKAYKYRTRLELGGFCAEWDNGLLSLRFIPVETATYALKR